MFLIPLTQPESVALVIHALRIAGGEADCSSCPVRKVCMKQCLTIAASIDNMLQTGILPSVDDGAPEPPPEPKAPAPGPGHLKIIK
ncbi:hypothetical protein Pcar_3114 [Syntrophotalea carbinolica DSM 2380]|uniref:Uncharacterized protein n=1 Tax=Syntrophotalea carbinolica (strain DSM 2380 / NBRC 103641 / GraBd1) TaxID=338963 RepID=Q39ZV8_SYNC1|nr:hypothetical protein [Syntrophotalea carbinolica]ABA90349.1 hypothetical protein Pcar_3114 [Syntrophotalea carbinolica DSM 2380]